MGDRIKNDHLTIMDDEIVTDTASLSSCARQISGARRPPSISGVEMITPYAM